MTRTKVTPEELVPLVFGAIRSVHAHLNRQHRLDLLGSSPLQLQALGFIKKQGSPLMKEVADFLSITPPSATSLIDGMVKDGLLVRHFDSADRRVVHLHATAKGQRLLKIGWLKMTEHMREMFACLSEKEKRQMLATYKKIADHFNNLK